MTIQVGVTDITNAARRIKGTVRRTPLIDVSDHVNRPLALKCENLQVAGSFKIRGAYNLMAQLVSESPQRGVITYSSGNHGQAVAYAARRLGLSAVVVMPETASPVKVHGARYYGAEVLLEGTTSIARQKRAEVEATTRGFSVVPPFDHPEIIAGQGTVGLEILEYKQNPMTIYVPIGGGGLISGIAAAVKSRQPDVRVIGVEPVGSAAMAASLAAGMPVTLESVSSIADGLLPVRPGDLTFAHVAALVDDIVTVDDEAIVKAVQWLASYAKLVVEPSGAATIAAVLFTPGHTVDKDNIVAVISGGNISTESFSSLLVRGVE